jgi:site-specific DNA recombinase
MGKTIRCVRYARYSSDNQREESITAQLRAEDAYIARKGYLCVGTYIDEEKTGTNDRREGFQRMIADAKMGLFDVVIIHKINRFARNRYDSAIYKRELKRNGVRVESVTENLDDSPESIILESMLEGMAEYYSLDLAREVRKGMYENAQQGIHIGGRPPYGLKVNPETRKYEIDDKTARVVRIYFEGIVNGLSLERIAETVNSLGYRTQTGKKFTKNSFDGWAYNRKYMGDYTWDVLSAKDADGRRNNHKKKPAEEQIVKKGTIPAIIERELWEKVNQMMIVRKHKPGKMKAKVNYLLSGKVVCGNCGATYTGNSYRNSKSSEKTLLCYYKCSAKCGNTSVRKENIENIAIEQLLNECFSDSAMGPIIDRVEELYQKQRKNSQDDIQPIKKELDELELTINNWMNALGKGIKGLEEKIVEAQNRQEALQYELERAEMMQKQAFVDRGLIMSILNEKKHSLLSANEDERKQVLQEYVDRIVIQPSRDINQFDTEITYRVFSGGGDLTLFKTLQVSYRL